MIDYEWYIVPFIQGTYSDLNIEIIEKKQKEGFELFVIDNGTAYFRRKRTKKNTTDKNLVFEPIMQIWLYI